MADTGGPFLFGGAKSPRGRNLSRGRCPIPWVDNCARVEPWTSQAVFEQAFRHTRTLAVHGTAFVSRPWQVGAFQLLVVRPREEQPPLRHLSGPHSWLEASVYPYPARYCLPGRESVDPDLPGYRAPVAAVPGIP